VWGVGSDRGQHSRNNSRTSLQRAVVCYKADCCMLLQPIGLPEHKASPAFAPQTVLTTEGQNPPQDRCATESRSRRRCAGLCSQPERVRTICILCHPPITFTELAVLQQLDTDRLCCAAVGTFAPSPALQPPRQHAGTRTLQALPAAVGCGPRPDPGTHSTGCGVPYVWKRWIPGH
jgi:hypothetical protein